MMYLKSGLALMILSFMVNSGICKHENSPEDFNYIGLERNQFGFIFTSIIVNGQAVKALIDFGDPNILQLSSRFTKENNIAVEATNGQAMHVDGSTFSIDKGLTDLVKIGNWAHEDVAFKSSPGEIESVSEQIGTHFDAVLGWGYFKQYFTAMYYAKNTFVLSKVKPQINEILLRKPYNTNSNYLSVEVDIDEEKANFILDTGSSYSFIDSTYVTQRDIDTLEFKLGENDLLLQLQPMDLSILRQINAVGIIGADFLNKYEILIDPFEKELILSSNN